MTDVRHSKLAFTLISAAALAAVTSGCGLFGPKYLTSDEVAAKLGLTPAAVSKDFYTNRVTISGSGHKLETAPGADWIAIDGRVVHLEKRVRMEGPQAAWPAETVRIARPTFSTRAP